MSFHTAAGNNKASCKISVVMSVFNGEKYLAQAMESILCQTFTDFEFIIIDDGSTDNTPKILTSYNDARIRIVSHENRGLTKSLNKAISLAQGEYVARMDADDLSHPQRFAAQVAELDSCHDIDLVGCFYEVIDSDGRVSQVVKLQTDPLYRLWRLQFHNIYAHGSVMMRSSALREAGGYNQAFLCSQDYDLWLRLSRSNNAQVIPHVLYSVRAFGGPCQISTQHRDAQAAFAIAISNQALAACNPTLNESDFQEARSLYLGRNASCFTRKGINLIPETVKGFCVKYGISENDEQRLTTQVVRDAVYVLILRTSVYRILYDARSICRLFALFPLHLVIAILRHAPRLLKRIFLPQMGSGIWKSDNAR